MLSAAGVLGAAVFLALSMDAPLSSVALVVGFTGQSWGAYVPLAVAVGGAWGVMRLWAAHRARVFAGALRSEVAGLLVAGGWIPVC